MYVWVLRKTQANRVLVIRNRLLCNVQFAQTIMTVKGRNPTDHYQGTSLEKEDD